MLPEILLLVLGLFLLVKGADFLVEGSSSIARRLGISTLAIGLMVVAFGTSLPELVVNLFSAAKGISGISVGNIVGSNMSNLLLILGLSAVVYPVSVKKQTAMVQLPVSLLAAVLLLVLFNIGDILSLKDSILLLAMFAAFFIYVWKSRARVEIAEQKKIRKPLSPPVSAIGIIMGCVFLFAGGKWVLDSAVMILEAFDISEVLISSTVIAVGTSLPELVTSLTAVFRKENDIAVGNVVGSNIINILLVLGVTGIVLPIPFNQAWNIDLGFLIAGTLVLMGMLLIGRKLRLGRFKGAVALLIYAAYAGFLVARG